MSDVLTFKCNNHTAYIYNCGGDYMIDAIQMRKFARILKSHYEIIDSKSTEKDKLIRLFDLWSDVSGVIGNYLSDRIKENEK